MQWIKYQIVQSVVGEETSFVTKKVSYSEDNLTIAKEEAYNGEYEIIEDSEVTEVEEGFMYQNKDGSISIIHEDFIFSTLVEQSY